MKRECVAILLLSIASVAAEAHAQVGTLAVEVVESDYALVRVALINTGATDTLYVIRPTDGGPPDYGFEIRTMEGEEPEERALRCGMEFYLWANTSWPDDYLVALPPGGRVEVRRSHGFFLHPGTYTVRASYSFAPLQPTTPRGEPWPANLWEGTVWSTTSTFVVEAGH